MKLTLENLRSLRGLRATSDHDSLPQHQRPIARSQSARSVSAGQAPDRGLYLPEKFPQLAPDEIAAFAQLPYPEIAFRVLSKFTDGIIPDDELAAMCRDAYNFPIPLEKIHDRVFLMRLDQGPTASFKDFAAQMMARMFGYFLRDDGRQVTILTATSGDTGSAVAHAFHKMPGVRVIVLFPIAEVSESQRKLMTTLRDNVRTVAIDGKFDDCQAMVKRAFADPGAETHSAVVRQLHQHRPAAAAERLLFLRRVAAGQARRADGLFHSQRQFWRHDGRGRRAGNGFAGEKNHRAGQRQRRLPAISGHRRLSKNCRRRATRFPTR